jgi:hypothetical protein
LTAHESKNGQPSKWDYNEGEKSLDGSVIHRIIGREEDFVVFLCEGGELSWEHRDVPEWSYVGIEQYQKLGRELLTLQGKIHEKQIKSFMAEALLSVFRSRNHEDSTVLKYFYGAWDFVSDYKKRKILFFGDDYYIHEVDFVVAVENPTNNKSLQKAFVDASLLSQRAKHSLNNEKLSRANASIAHSFVNFEKSDTENIFAKATKHIDSQIEENARIDYLIKSIVTSFGGAILLSVILYFFDSIPEGARQIIICSLAGIGGAFVSVLERSKSITVDAYSSSSLLAFQGVTRVVLGIIFGALVPICAKANIALGLASDNVYAIFVVAFLAGLNERFIPDLMKKNIN